jgi:hypothetical protein
MPVVFATQQDMHRGQVWVLPGARVTGQEGAVDDLEVVAVGDLQAAGPGLAKGGRCGDRLRGGGEAGRRLDAVDGGRVDP